MHDARRELPVTGGPEKRVYVRQMFGAIAPTYDRLNRIISFRLDLRWRRIAVQRMGWERAPKGRYIDLCAGTMDFGAILSRQPGFRGEIVGADFVRRMLELGRSKSTRLKPVAADAIELPFSSAIFDGAMVGWGVRNLIDLDAGLVEAARVLKPGARLAMYSEHVLPVIGRIISKHRTAYSWLPESALHFPSPPELVRRMEEAGFTDVSFTRFLGGVTALHVGTKKDRAP
jgi:demethylmenaquinone methyltransferase/2-methoxy-6-polyprenyl-1,4-benzoquinol methylase